MMQCREGKELPTDLQQVLISFHEDDDYDDHDDDDDFDDYDDEIIADFDDNDDDDDGGNILQFMDSATEGVLLVSFGSVLQGSQVDLPINSLLNQIQFVLPCTLFSKILIKTKFDERFYKVVQLYFACCPYFFTHSQMFRFFSVFDSCVLIETSLKPH